MRCSIVRPVAILAALALSACDKDSSGIGTLHGRVKLYDEAGVTQPGNEGVVVEAAGVTTTSSATGDYELANVRSGNQEVVYAKPGYGTYRATVKIEPGQTTQASRAVALGKVPTGIVATSVSDFHNLKLILSCVNLPVQPYPQAHRLYFGPDLNVTKDNYTFSLPFVAPANKAGFTDTIALQAFRDHGFTPFKLVGVRAYAENPAADSYTNAKGALVNPTIGPAARDATSFMLP